MSDEAPNDQTRLANLVRQGESEAPEFEEITGAAVVRFRVPAGTTGAVTPQVTAQVAAFCRLPRSAREIMTELGLKHWKTFQSNYLSPLLAAGILARTIPDKPNSRLQKYRLTDSGRKMLEKRNRG